jgi:mono/diheme cytochrome c family protein
MKSKVYFISILFMGVFAAFFVSCNKDNTSPNDDQAAYDAANGVNGAQIYDHPLNYVLADQDKYPNEYTNFFRCKSCHGWDLLGQKGVLINKPSSSTYPTAVDVNLYEWAHAHTIREVFDKVKNTGGRIYSDPYNSTHPDYGQILTDEQIWDVVKFLKETAHDVSEFYDMTTSGTYPNGTRSFSNLGKGGDPDAGLATYKAKCASCHGNDGKQIDIYCKGLFLGEMFRHDPHEIQHKAIWGMPKDREHIDAGCEFAGSMPSMDITDQDIRNMMVAGQDTTVFPD